METVFNRFDETLPLGYCNAGVVCNPAEFGIVSEDAPALTGLIFGCHHKVFGQASFVQILQTVPGEATFFVTGDRDALGEEKELTDLFDLKGVDMQFSFECIREPIRTQSGKVKLKINQEDLCSH